MFNWGFSIEMKFSFVIVKPYLMVLASAILCALAQVMILPNGFELPIGWFGWLMWVGLVPFIVSLWSVLKQNSAIKALKISALFYFIYYLITTYWLTLAVTVFGGLPWWLSIFMLFGLTAMITCIMAPGPVIAAMVSKNFSIPLWITLPTAWVASEYLRLHSFTHFPWANISDSQTLCNLWLVQLAEWTGQNGIAWLLVAANVMISQYVLGIFHRRQSMVLCFLIAFTFIFGFMRLSHWRSIEEVSDPEQRTTRVIALQGNISQNEKWDQDQRTKIIRVHQELLAEARKRGADLVVWPEAAFPFMLLRNAKTFPVQFSKANKDIFQLIGAPSKLGSSFFNNDFFR